MKVEALKHGIPVLQPEKVRLDEEIDKVLALQPDLIVTAAFGQILPKRLLMNLSLAVSMFMPRCCQN